MKKRMLLVWLLVFQSMFCANAQPIPCDLDESTPGCDPMLVPWKIVKDEFAFSACGDDCKFEVVYAYRCCNCNTDREEQQLEILQISTSNNCTKSCGRNDLQAAALIAILKNNIPLDFKPRDGRPGCSSTHRVVNAQCMRSYYRYARRFVGVDPTTGLEKYEDDTSLPAQLVLEMCARGGCCSQKLEVCRNGQGEISIKANPSSLGYAPEGCPRAKGDTLDNWIEGENIPTDGRCYFNCDYLIHTRFTQQPIIKPSDDDGESSSRNMYRSIPSGRLIVRSLVGTVVCILQCDGKQLNSLLDEVSINSNLPSGVYSYAVEGFESIAPGTFVVKP
jgi:hypothetical protein